MKEDQENNMDKRRYRPGLSSAQDGAAATKSKPKDTAFPGRRGKEHHNRNAARETRPFVSKTQYKPDLSNKSYDHLQSYEVKAKHAGKEKKTFKRGDDASHLLNFSYKPAEQQERRARWRPARSITRLSKEQFLLANCQFVVNMSEGEYQHYQADPDRHVSWEDIIQVKMFAGDQSLSCPICLEYPVAAKMTKCSHVYCWPCILHYLSLSERKWAKCPICADPVHSEDLKSVQLLMSPSFKVGDEIILQLMKRERGSQYVRPVPYWSSTGATKLYSVSDAESDVQFSKLLMAEKSDLERMLEKERRELQQLLDQEDTETIESSFIEAALNIMAELERKLLRQGTPSIAQVTSEKVTESVEEPVAECILKPQDAVVSYVDAFDDELGDFLTDVGTTLTVAEIAPTGAHSVDPSTVGDEPVGKPSETNEHISGRMRNSSSTSSAGSVDCAEQVSVELSLPPTGTQTHGRTEVYYFYQGTDGQHIYLNSLNARMLATQYGSLELAPSTIRANIVETESTNMTAEVRKRLKYLGHLPLHCQFSVVEVALKPPVVSSAVISHFREELERRKKLRNRRLRTEKQQSRKAQAEERRAMGKFPDMRLRLNSEFHFPESRCNPVEESLVSSQSAEPVESTAPAPVTLSTATGRTPYSFASAMRSGSGSSAQLWAKAGPRTPQQSASANRGNAVEENELSPPDFHSSFGAAIDAAFESLTVEKKVAGKKKKKKVLLLSTARQSGTQ